MALIYEAFLAYARLSAENLADEPQEAVTAELCYQAAVDSAKSCGIPVDTLESRKMELYIYAVALYDFDNRGFAILDHSHAATAARERKMNQMKIELELEGWKLPEMEGVSYGI